MHAPSPTAPCSCCGTISKRVQSRYTRTLRGLPASGCPVHLMVHVRRFFCQQSTCIRKILAERFPSLTLPRAKFTLRWSNGPTEGHVNRLKLIKKEDFSKRSMYGRAKFDLLRQRVLHSTATGKKSQDAKTEVHPIQQRHSAKKQRGSPCEREGKGRCPLSQERLFA